MYKITVHMVSLNKHVFDTDTKVQAFEYAKRIITEGLWILEIEDKVETEVFYPVHQVYKVKVQRV